MWSFGFVRALSWRVLFRLTKFFKERKVPRCLNSHKASCRVVRKAERRNVVSVYCRAMRHRSIAVFNKNSTLCMVAMILVENHQPSQIHHISVITSQESIFIKGQPPCFFEAKGQVHNCRPRFADSRNKWSASQTSMAPVKTMSRTPSKSKKIPQSRVNSNKSQNFLQRQMKKTKQIINKFKKITENQRIW